MKVIDILKLCSCKVDIYYKGQYATTYEDYKDINNIEEWLLNSNVVDLDTYEDNYDCTLLEVYSE